MYRTPPHRPSSSPFPYTTLFRSNSAARARRVGSGSHTTTAFAPAALAIAHADSPSGPAPKINTAPPATDRKSTRLNSSHTVISYAVFCLKKKNEKRKIEQLQGVK